MYLLLLLLLFSCEDRFKMSMAYRDFCAKLLSTLATESACCAWTYSWLVVLFSFALWMITIGGVDDCRVFRAD